MYLEREKNELKRLTFSLKSEIRVELNERGGIVRIILLLRELFITDQYDLADIFGSCNVRLSLFRNLSLASVIQSKISNMSLVPPYLSLMDSRTFSRALIFSSKLPKFKESSILVSCNQFLSFYWVYVIT